MLENLIPILNAADPQKAASLFKDYTKLIAPDFEANSGINEEDMQVTVEQWMNLDKIEFAEHDGKPEEVLPSDWAKLVEKRGQDGIPKSWRDKLVKAKWRKSKS